MSGIGVYGRWTGISGSANSNAPVSNAAMSGIEIFGIGCRVWSTITVGNKSMSSARSTPVAVGLSASTKGICCSLAASLGIGPFGVGGVGGAVEFRKPTMSRNVWMAPSCSGLTGGASGSFSCNAERISTRLMESIPKSASSDMSGFNISAG